MPRPPNILLITSDQQRVDSLSCYGSSFTSTPHLDRLGAEGVICSRAYTTNPVCTPSRASLFSGCMVSRHGAWNVGTSIPEDLPLLSHRLGGQGYSTHYIGKAHFQPFMCSPQESAETVNGWTERYPGWNGPYYGFERVELALGHSVWGLAGHYGAWVREQVTQAEFEGFGSSTMLSRAAFGGEASDWDLPLELHNSQWTADRTLDALQHLDPAVPFLLAVGFQDPHHPHALPTAFTNRVDPQLVPLPDFLPDELADKPSYFEEAHRGTFEDSPWRGRYPMAGQGGHLELIYGKVNEQEARLGRAYYYGMVKLMDEHVGRILEGLEACGLAENTLVIFASDHGDLLGDHGLWQKGAFHYEPLIKVPLLLRWPQGFDGGRRIASVISMCDLAPTVLGAAGVDGQGMDGFDLLPTLRGHSAQARDHVLIECVDDPDKLRLKTIVTSDRKLTRYASQDIGELYDLERDPHEKVNLWNDSRYRRDQGALLALLLDDLERLERRQPRLSYA